MLRPWLCRRPGSTKKWRSNSKHYNTLWQIGIWTFLDSQKQTLVGMSFQRSKDLQANCQWSLTHNQTESNKSTHQPGGTSILCVNQVAHWTSLPGNDPLGLGRWCWTQICSPNGFFVWVIVMYHPCSPTDDIPTTGLMINQTQTFQMPKGCYPQRHHKGDSELARVGRPSHCPNRLQWCSHGFIHPKMGG